ncbi:hypothetical protein BDV10DRAFT_162315 [Aspergillus recurvatus]
MLPISLRGQTNALGGPDQGELQQYALLHAHYAARIPDLLSLDEKATIPVIAVASVVTLFRESGLGLEPSVLDGDCDYSTESILVIDGGSNTGKFGLQFAALAGFEKLITTTSTRDPAKVKYLKSLRATHVGEQEGEFEDVLGQIREIEGGLWPGVCP